jgi:nitrate/TMAO reductase-like tetraheme cytochrome c subunit
MVLLLQIRLQYQVSVMSCIRLTFGLILLLSSLLFSVSTQSAENGCISCHQQSDFYAQYPKLHDYYQQYLLSPHKQAGVTCDDCHGGNAGANSVNKAHVGVLPMSDKNSTVHYQKQPETCGQCHADKRRQFVKSKHYAALMDQRAAPTCTTCHPAMSRRPELRIIVLHACRNCHGEGNSENLPLIADQAERVFSQLNIAGGLLGWTRIHFESHDWPADSRERVQSLEMRYQTIVDNVHQFNLQQTDSKTAEILGQLREIFEEVQRAHEQEAADS